MKAVIALVIAVALLAIGIPLSRAISDGDEHTITRTIDPAKPGDMQQADALPANPTASEQKAATQTKADAAQPDAAKR